MKDVYNICEIKSTKLYVHYDYSYVKYVCDCCRIIIMCEKTVAVDETGCHNTCTFLNNLFNTTKRCIQGIKQN